jgi:cytochrome c55X
MQKWLSSLACALLAATASMNLQADIPPQRQAEILYLLKHDCGSCHGMRLEGGLGPSLTPQRLQPYGTDFLVITILQGRPGTPMPPWRPFLTSEEAYWLANQLKQGINP